MVGRPQSMYLSFFFVFPFCIIYVLSFYSILYYLCCDKISIIYHSGGRSNLNTHFVVFVVVLVRRTR